jgi:hypothetical protein
VSKASRSSAAGPLARNTELTVEHLSSETIIYDH